MSKYDDFKIWLKKNLDSCLSWAITFGWLIFIYLKIHNGILPTDLNEFGDFIAGVFAPLAFFWLVRGFYQQGKGLEQNSEALKMQSIELKKTTEALELQVQEMKASVKQQSRLAQVYEDELQQKHFQVRPNLDYSFQLLGEHFRDECILDDENSIVNTYKEKIVELKLVVENLGEMARNLQIKSTTYPYLRKNQPKFEHSAILNINFEIDGQFAAELTEQECCITILFDVTYQNVYGKSYRNQLTCEVESVFDCDTEQIYLKPTFERLDTVF